MCEIYHISGNSILFHKICFFTGNPGESFCFGVQFLSYPTSHWQTVVSFLFYFFVCRFTSLSTLQVVSRRVVGRAEEISTYSSSVFCTVNCRKTASNYQLSHLRPCWEPNPWPQRWEARMLPLCHRGPGRQWLGIYHTGYLILQHLKDHLSTY